jgi:predicted small secreted protein
MVIEFLIDVVLLIALIIVVADVIIPLLTNKKCFKIVKSIFKKKPIVKD